MNKLTAIEKYYNDPNFCKNCGKIIEITSKRYPSDARRMKFCCRSCAGSYNNYKYPKRVADECTFCHCGGRKDKRAELCHPCKTANTVDNQYSAMVKDFIYHGNARVKYAQIRKLARQFIELWEIPFTCERCGYELHVEVCHIIPIAEFEDHGRIIDVNNPNNLICLCRNCHWELDHGHLDITMLRDDADGSNRVS